MSEGSDRRATPRAPIELKVEYRKLNTFFADYTKNISKGGTFIATEKPLPLGTQFVFKLGLPRRPSPVELKGEVVWANQVGDIQRPEVPEMGMGIRFLFSNEAERVAFGEEVEALMIASLGRQLYEQLIGHKGS